MAGVVVSVATGALKPLVEKLAAALGDEYKRFKGVRGEIKSLAAELEAMHAFLLKMSEEEDPHVQDKAWMKEVRELSYDMEDSLDEFMLRVDAKSDNPDGLVDKFKKFVTKAKARRKIAKAIEDLKLQVKEMGDRNSRYKKGEFIPKRSNESVDRRALVIFEEASKLVGMDGPKNEVIELLKKKDGQVASQQTKVLSIVGFGGLGKTTLANQVYQELKGEFDCKAFVTMSRNPEKMSVLQNILFHVNNKPHPNIQQWNIQLLISKINESLTDKRYLIVIYDIWTKDAWETINYALFKNDKDSIIIITTRMHDVANACCSSDANVVYQMKPLGPADSRMLFFKRLFGSEDKCPEALKGISNKILEKCDGVPLAIISISGLLANITQTRDEWSRVQDSVGRGLANNPGVQNMRQILSLSYFDLPHQLKTCLLYISIFPEDYNIDKGQLIRRWIAEGFIQEEHGYTLYALGERYFNELINRSLIQPRNLNIYGDVTACQVHDIILDFIVSKSQEENLITVVGDGYKMPCAHSKLRRLSLHASSKEKVSLMTQQNLCCIRSVTVFNNSVELYSWSNFHFLRVLDLQGCRKVEGHHLVDIGNLFQLRYLGLRETGVYELPAQIRKLQYLETLDLKGTRITELLASITQLRRLVCLAVDGRVKLPDGIGSMTALEDLDCLDIFKQSIDFTRELGQLENLRNIRFFLSSNKCRTTAEGSNYKEYMSNIFSSLYKLGNLHSMSIHIDPAHTEDCSLDSGSGPPSVLRKFEITGHFISKVPNWTGSLVNLQVLTLYVMEIEVQDIMALGRLPALVFLHLVAPETFPGRRITISGDDGFQCLQHFDYGCAIPVTFEAGAMPKLKKLTLLLSVPATSFLVGHEYFRFRFGMQHLSSLHTVHCQLCLNEQSAVSWIDDMKTQMADMPCELAKVWIDMMQATLFRDAWKGDDIVRAVRTHLNSDTLELTETTSWTMPETRSMLISTPFLAPSGEQITPFLAADRRTPFMTSTVVAWDILRPLNRQVMDRIRICPLKGLGNCQCQGLPEARSTAPQLRLPSIDILL